MKKTQILIVEDEGLIAKDLQAMLKRLGYDVPVTVGTGELAIQTAAQNQPDLILMDIQLRGNMDGVEAAETIQANQKIPIVFLTANSDEPTFQRAKITDPFGFLIKPFEERGLHAGIEMALYKHQSEKRTHERERWLSTTLRSIADGVITTDENGVVTFLNDVAERLLGWTPGECAGRHYSEIIFLLDEATRQAPEDFIAGALKEGRSRSNTNSTLLLTRSGANIHIEHSAAPIRYSEESVAGCVIVLRDVSEHRKLESELRQSQKMDAIGKLAGSIAHDFNNAITAVMGYSSLILARLPDADPLRGDAEQILRAGEHSARLTRQLLAFSRKQILQPVALNLGVSLREMHGLLRRLIRENISLNLSVPDGLWMIKADPGHLEQLVFNMAINARDAMPHGGTLTIALRNVIVSAETSAKISGSRPGEFVELQISDTGTGMSPEILEQIFEPFFTTKAADKGTGLGLSTCQTIVKRAEGFITVSSMPGAGTTFSIYFPHLQEAAVARPEPAEVSPRRQRNETILLVDDDEPLRKMAIRVLEGAGCTVLEADDGEVALEVFNKCNAKVDLVITDMVMPQMGGRELVERIRSAGSEVKVLFMSGYTDDELLCHAVVGSQVDFLQKPFNPDVLLRTVAKILERERPRPVLQG